MRVLDWKNRPYILGTDVAFSEKEDEVELYMDWSDLEYVKDYTIQEIKEKYPLSAHKYIFHRLYLAEHTATFNTSDSTKKDKLIERAINGGVKRWEKEMDTRLEFITMINTKHNSIGSVTNPFRTPLYTTLVEQQTKGAIVLMSVDLYFTDWVQKELDLSKAKEVRLFNKSRLPYSEAKAELLKDMKVYNNPEEMLRRSGKGVPVVVLGDSTLYRELYERLTDLIVVFSNMTTRGESDLYFTDIQVSHFDMLECHKIEEEVDGQSITIQPTYLKKYSNRQLKWKESIFDESLKYTLKKKGKKENE